MLALKSWKNQQFYENYIFTQRPRDFRQEFANRLTNDPKNKITGNCQMSSNTGNIHHYNLGVI